MQLATLAAKQKRILDWREFLRGGGTSNPHLRAQTKATLLELSQLLAACWSAKSVTPEQESRIADLERRLEALNEESRYQGNSFTTTK